MMDELREAERERKRLHLLDAWPRSWRLRVPRRALGSGKARIVVLDFHHGAPNGIVNGEG